MATKNTNSVSQENVKQDSYLFTIPKEHQQVFIRGYKKNTLVNIQAKNEYGQWMNVFTTKGGKWYSIDKGFLEALTVGTMRESFPEMCDMQIWERMGANNLGRQSLHSKLI